MVDISEDTIQQAARGDTDAFEAIYRTYGGFVYRVAYRVLGHRQDAEEVTQDVFVRAFHQLRNFRFESSLQTWLYRITVNTSLNAKKKAARQHARLHDYRQQLNNEEKGQKEIPGTKDDRQAQLLRLLEHLNADQRACIILRSIEGLSYEEIAQALNININTVRTRLKRARQKLLKIKNEVMSHDV